MTTRVLPSNMATWDQADLLDLFRPQATNQEIVIENANKSLCEDRSEKVKSCCDKTTSTTSTSQAPGPVLPRVGACGWGHGGAFTPVLPLDHPCHTTWYLLPACRVWIWHGSPSTRILVPFSTVGHGSHICTWVYAHALLRGWVYSPLRIAMQRLAAPSTWKRQVRGALPATCAH